jgi:VanZ family protein
LAKFIKNYFWAFLWSLFILTICFIPSTGLPKINFFSDYPIDKVVHFFLYFIQSSLFLLVGTYKISTNLLRRKHILFTLFYSLLLGIAIEIIQQYCIVGRSGDFYDVLADLIGILLGLCFFIRKKSNLIEPI